MKKFIQWFWKKTFLKKELRTRADVRLLKNSEEKQKLMSKPPFVSEGLFSKNLVTVQKIKELLTLNKTAYIGMCIFDLSTI